MPFNPGDFVPPGYGGGGIGGYGTGGGGTGGYDGGGFDLPDPRPTHYGLPDLFSNFGRRVDPLFENRRERRQFADILDQLWQGEAFRDFWMRPGGKIGFGKRGVFGLKDFRRMLQSGLLGDHQGFFQGIYDRWGGPGTGDGPGPDAGGDVLGGGGGGVGGLGGAHGGFGGGDIGGILEGLLGEGHREVDPLGRLRSPFEDALLALLENPGMDPELLEGMRNNVRGASKNRERDRLLRRADDFNSRGIFSSGLTEEGLRDIEQDESTALLGSLNQIDYQNAMYTLQSLDRAFQGTLGLGNLNLAAEGLGSSEFLESLRLAISRELGLGDLALGQGRLDLDRQIQELMANLDITRLFGGGMPELDDTGVSDQSNMPPPWWWSFNPPGNQIPRY
jgi:hypothetical protein